MATRRRKALYFQVLRSLAARLEDVASILRGGSQLFSPIPMRRSSFLALAVASLCALAAAARASEPLDRVVRVRATSIDGTASNGSGVIIGPERVATACHVTRRATAIVVVHGDQRWEASTEMRDELHDLCVLHVSADELAPIPLRRSEELHVGDVVTAVGFEGANSDVLARRGVVAGLYPYDGGYVIRTSAQFDFGSSGGALFDDIGNLVGILAFRARSGENLRFALPADWLLHMDPVADTSTSSYASAFWELSQGDRPAFLGVALREVTDRLP